MPKRRLSDQQIPDLIVKVELLIEKVKEDAELTERIEERLKKLEVDYVRYRSFLGGVLFFLTALWAFLSTVWANAKTFLHNLVQ